MSHLGYFQNQILWRNSRLLKIDFEENVSSSDDINPSIGLLLPIVVTGGLQLNLLEVEVNNRLHNRLTSSAPTELTGKVRNRCE